MRTTINTSRPGSNPLPPATMTPRERRTELCALLALGLMRLRMREQGQHIERTETFRYTTHSTRAVVQVQPNGGPNEYA